MHAAHTGWLSSARSGVPQSVHVCWLSIASRKSHRLQKHFSRAVSNSQRLDKMSNLTIHIARVAHRVGDLGAEQSGVTFPDALHAGAHAAFGDLPLGRQPRILARLRLLENETAQRREAITLAGLNVFLAQFR